MVVFLSIPAKQTTDKKKKKRSKKIVLISEKQPTNSFAQLTVYICAKLMETHLKMLAVVIAVKGKTF